MKSKLKYERPKLVELTSNEWNIGFGQSSAKGCTGGNSPDGLVCGNGFNPGGKP
jgi:hypothetical protein